MTQHQITIMSMKALLSALRISVTLLLSVLPWVLFLETHFFHPFWLSLLWLAAHLASAIKWLSILSLLTLLSSHRFLLCLSLPVPEFTLHSGPPVTCTGVTVLIFALYTTERLFNHLSRWTVITSCSLFFVAPGIPKKRDVFSLRSSLVTEKNRRANKRHRSDGVNSNIWPLSARSNMY